MSVHPSRIAIVQIDPSIPAECGFVRPSRLLWSIVMRPLGRLYADTASTATLTPPPGRCRFWDSQPTLPASVRPGGSASALYPETPRPITRRRDPPPVALPQDKLRVGCCSGPGLALAPQPPAAGRRRHGPRPWPGPVRRCLGGSPKLPSGFNSHGPGIRPSNVALWHDTGRDLIQVS